MLEVGLVPDEVDLVLALLIDRKMKSENLAKNSASRTTRHARAYELTILERIAEKLGGWPAVDDDEIVDDTDAPGGLVCDETDLHEGRLSDEPPAPKKKPK
jgi:hypothetical protein